MTVCVTGAAGFIGSHLVCELLTHGATVRAAVRDASDATKVGHLERLAASLGARDRLSLHSAPLDQSGAFDAVVDGCDWVFHLATAMTGNEMVESAIVGTDNLLQAVAKASSVSGLAVTSSITAVVSESPRPDHVFTEDDWFDGKTTGSYAAGKTLSERRVWEFTAKVAPERELCTLVVNPTLVVGPPLSPSHVGSSLRVIKDLIDGRYLGTPPIGYGIVHVADVVKALRLGMERRIAGRFILNAGDLWMKDIAAVLSAALPAHAVSSGRILAALRFVVATWRRQGIAGVFKQWGRLDRVSAEKAARAFEIKWRTPESALRDFCQALPLLD